ncbi:NAD(P)/FAD-dependent oxidoreductase [Gordonia humi]|uniref:3-phenylpropionate/trans-cinnamate dioxygenase ferredoxin reductase subunit n=1 Tax=Gordonia humi TaxID=686429 RepID=A0A840ET51_9ACTN|nr:FAD-dependent oxidoreductase [Gordonia humi]MBB4133473.1 3-phenylpropionate/trans-cinnamate dioxygenase ferredoxin reductase subunit [Gordonia humi]
MSVPGVVVVGAGTAGVTAATTLRDRGFDGPLTLIGDEPEHPYRRTALTKELLAADLSVDRISLHRPDVWDAKGIDLRRGRRVVAVEPARRIVVCDDDQEIGYRALILATGARAARPVWLDGVPTLRILSDALAVREVIESAGRLTVLGGGLIGLELAASAASRGMPVDIVEAGDRLASRVVPAAVSDWLRALHERAGVTVRVGARATSVTPEAIGFADGTLVDGPVVAAVGMTPNIDLAVSSGIETSAEGIDVDAVFATSEPGVFAVGDCAATPDSLTGLPTAGGHWFGATDQGRAVASSVLAHLTGDAPEPFRDVPRAWTIQHGVNVQTVGWPSAGGDVRVEGCLDSADAAVRVSVDGELIGAVTVGRAAQARALRTEIAAGLRSTP